MGGKRALRLMRREGLLAPKREARRRVGRPHEGRIVPEAPNLRWGANATLGLNRLDGWVWVFCLVDHYTAEAWTQVAKVGDRFAALSPLQDAAVERFEELRADVARGIVSMETTLSVMRLTPSRLCQASGSHPVPQSGALARTRKILVSPGRYLRTRRPCWVPMEDGTRPSRR